MWTNGDDFPVRFYIRFEINECIAWRKKYEYMIV